MSHTSRWLVGIRPFEIWNISKHWNRKPYISSLQGGNWNTNFRLDTTFRLFKIQTACSPVWNIDQDAYQGSGDEARCLAAIVPLQDSVYSVYSNAENIPSQDAHSSVGNDSKWIHRALGHNQSIKSKIRLFKKSSWQKTQLVPRQRTTLSRAVHLSSQR